MATMYVWLFIFGGAALVVFGIFLFGSGRKPGKPRRRSDELRRSHQFSEAHEMASPAESTTTNAELVEKVSTPSSRLEERERMIEELQSEQRQLVSARYDNQELQGKIANLTKQLHSNEWRLSESAREIQQLVQRNTHLQNEVSDLKQQLQASQTRIQELEVEHQRLRDQLQTTEALLAVTAGEHREVVERDSQSQAELAQMRPQFDRLMIRNKELLAVIDSLSNTLAANERTIEELQTIRHDLQSENQTLWAANCNLEEELASLYRELQTAESLLATTTKQYDEIADRHTRLQSEFARLREESDQLRMKKQALVEQSLSLPTELAAEMETVCQELTPGETEAKIRPENELGRPAAWSLGERGWRVGVIPAGAALAILGAIAIGFVGIRPDKFFASKETAGALKSGSDQEHTRVQGVSATPQKPGPSVAAPPKTEVSKQTSPAAPESRLKGAFKIIHPTELFTGPSEESALIATIGPGTKVNVVDSRLGWLEIRGQGRRSGFVRQESAVRIDPNG